MKKIGGKGWKEVEEKEILEGRTVFDEYRPCIPLLKFGTHV
jgi:hypothetical protein